MSLLDEVRRATELQTAAVEAIDDLGETDDRGLDDLMVYAKNAALEAQRDLESALGLLEAAALRQQIVPAAHAGGAGE